MERGKGWIMLHRRLMEGKTFSRLTAIQKLIAIYIILNANHKDGIWFDKYKNIEVPVKRGQLIVSRNKIINEWFDGDKDITDRKIRTTLNKLNGEFLTIETTNNYTLLTVLNYDTYQRRDSEGDQRNDQEPTSNRPSPDQETTTNNNDNNVKNEKNNISPYGDIEPEAQTEKNKTTKTVEEASSTTENQLNVDDPSAPTLECHQRAFTLSTVENMTEETTLEPTRPPEKEKIPYQQIVDMFHRICTSYAQIHQLTETRKRHIKSRWMQLGKDAGKFQTLFCKAEASDFMKGKNNKNWVADFDWLIKNDTNCMKVLEGRYDNKGGRTNSGSPIPRAFASMMEALNEDGGNFDG